MFYPWGKSDCFKTPNYGAVAARSAITFRCLSFINKRRVTIAIALFFIEKQQTSKALPSNLKREEERNENIAFDVDDTLLDFKLAEKEGATCLI